MNDEDGQGLSPTAHGTPGQTQGGCRRLLGTPGLVHLRTCPTRSGGASQGRNCWESSRPGSWAPEPTPLARSGGAAICRCHLRHRFHRSGAGWTGQSRTSVPGRRQDPPRGEGPRPPRGSRQRVLPLRETALQTSPAPGPPNLRARLPATERPRSCGAE